MEHGKSQSFFYYVKQVFLGVLDGGFVVLTLSAAFVTWVYVKATPPAEQLVDRKIAQTSVIYDSSGEHTLYEIHGEENRKIVPHDEIPDYMRKATVATEDSNFYNHYGIDPLAITRALKVNFENNQIRQGASTITQQLARNAFLTPERTIKRKFLEAVLAIKIEREYSKDEILDHYLNEVPYGANAYGIETASQTLFGKHAKDLTLDEAAFMAALPKAPSFYSPYGTHTEETVARQKKVLEKMGELKMISESEMQQAFSTDTLKKIKPLSQPMQFPHFVFYVLDQLESKYGKEFVATGGLKIHTTIDYDMQKMAEDVVERGAQRAASYGASNAALVAVDPKTGNILAMVGSKDFYDENIDGQVNVTTRPRQPGSSFKPFVYAAAFIKGYQPETMILDAPTDFGPGGANGRNYIPRNYDGRFHGLLPMRSTLAMSLNVPAVKVLYLTGIDAAIDLAHKMGITTLNDRHRYGLSLVLGGGEVKLLDMASAFSVFATEGVRNPATPILKIVDGQGNTYEQLSSSPQRVIDVQIARKINSILSDNNARTPIFGPHSSLVIDGKTVAAKTGTTSEFRDAWTVGYTPSISVGVWAGNNNNKPMRAGADGVFVAAPIWKDFMVRILADRPDEKFAPYDTYKEKNGSDGLKFKMKPKVTYYNSKTGKKISEEKARKTDPKKVEKRIEYVPDYGSGSDNKSPRNVALPDPNDPAYKKWTDQLKKSEKSDKKDDDDD